jgi:teichuronic acid biosynthesis glycosyltransferase TuaH
MSISAEKTDDLVLFCAGTSWDGGWYPEKHIASRLSRSFRILYVNPPASALKAYGTPHDSLKVLDSRIAVYSPVGLPGSSKPFLRHIALHMFRSSIRSAVSRLGAKRVRALVVANQFCLFGAVPAQRNVMYATDDFVSGASLMGGSQSFLKHQELCQAKEADLVIAVSETIQRQWRGLGHQAVLIPNGCDTERFKETDSVAWPSDVTLPYPIAGVFGHLSERIDLSLLEAVAQQRHSILLVGSRSASFPLERLLQWPNVQYVGPKPFEQMPSYMRAIKVGLTPYTHSDFNRASFPMKTVEYLAAGRRVVSTKLPAVAFLDTELIRTADTPAEFAEATSHLLADKADLGLQCKEFASRHSWQIRADAFADALLSD